MSKPLLHFKIDHDKHYPELIANFMRYLEESIGDDYDIICSPFDAEQITGDKVLFRFNGIGYTYNEVLEAIKKIKS